MALQINYKIFKSFFQSGAISGVILLLCVVLSLLLANSSWASAFHALLNHPMGFSSESIHLRYSLTQWINDGLMAVFFLLVGLEIKRELVEGELSSLRNALLPVASAFGGAIVPALLFAVWNGRAATAAGWGIPMATDIAFALGILSLLGKRVPSSLRIFLAALAIADDLIAILVIALFYSSKIHFAYLGAAAVMLLLQIMFNKLNRQSLLYYLIPGVFMWYFIHHSGIHATIAGVLTALTLPTTQTAVESPLEKLEHGLTKPVNWLIMPLFALANTPIRFTEGMVNGLMERLGMGIIFGLVLGKPLGIGLSSWLIVKLGWGVLPAGAGNRHLLGLGLLGGIGFTMSIFIALLSFPDPALQSEAKFAILIASTLSGILGYLVLRWSGKRRASV